MTGYLLAVMTMLGRPQNHYADPYAWDRLHAELGIRLPTDYQTLVDAYAPIQLNGHLYLSHPATERWNLGDRIRDTARAWSANSWDDPAPWILVEDGEGGWARCDMGFAERLYRYLIGEDMAGPNTSAFCPGPVQLRRLPMADGERPEPWTGPYRGM
ncbi:MULTISPECIES: hypothetical protein [Streptomyces]|nr:MULTISPECIES: hypothetical protein [Streptomyces]KQX30471.1 hypothetical protein ASD29_16580 [Streptomyces sp. Root1295]KRA40402.1 hypothetical protein ASD97_11400 [Streptomyces sp. Root63]